MSIKWLNKAPEQLKRLRLDQGEELKETRSGAKTSKNGDFHRKSNSTGERKSMCMQQSSKLESRRPSYEGNGGNKYAQTHCRWIGDYDSLVYLMDGKVLKDVLTNKICAHYRLFKKIPIYSFTHGNDKELNTKKCSTCYLSKNLRSRYNLVVVGYFLKNSNRALHEI